MPLHLINTLTFDQYTNIWSIALIFLWIPLHLIISLNIWSLPLHLINTFTFDKYPYIWSIASTFDQHPYIWSIPLHLINTLTFDQYPYIWSIPLHLINALTFDMYLLKILSVYHGSNFWSSCLVRDGKLKNVTNFSHVMGCRVNRGKRSKLDQKHTNKCRSMIRPVTGLPNELWLSFVTMIILLEMWLWFDFKCVNSNTT